MANNNKCYQVVMNDLIKMENDCDDILYEIIGIIPTATNCYVTRNHAADLNTYINNIYLNSEEKTSQVYVAVKRSS